MQLLQYVDVRIVAPNPEMILSCLAKNGITIVDTVIHDLLTIEVRIRKFQYPLAEQLLTGKEISFRIVRKSGILWRGTYFLKRPVLVLGLLVFLLTSLYLPNRILFLKVSGNQMLNAGQILYYAEEAGIHFGCKTSIVRSENVKNKILTDLPQLQWLGITTSGCVATIHVQERSDQNDRTVSNSKPSNIVACCDGVITEMIVHTGTPVVHIGQSVNNGDILVSGSVDLGKVEKISHSEAEVFAYTKRNYKAYTINPTIKRGEVLNQHACYKLKLGKKVINFCNHSSISDATCVKMYTDYYCYLPGGFRLPVMIIKQIWTEYQVEPAISNPEYVSQWLPTYLRGYLNNQIIAGSVLREKYQWEFADDFSQLAVQYSCHEMIGRSKYEEYVIQNAEDN